MILPLLLVWAVVARCPHTRSRDPYFQSQCPQWSVLTHVLKQYYVTDKHLPCGIIKAVPETKLNTCIALADMHDNIRCIFEGFEMSIFLAAPSLKLFYFP